jgi:hypothetical protein
VDKFLALFNSIFAYNTYIIFALESTQPHRPLFLRTTTSPSEMIAADKIMATDKMTATDSPSSAQPPKRYAKLRFALNIESSAGFHILTSSWTNQTSL